MYMYSTGKNTKTMVQIVKGELRKVGDWDTYSIKAYDHLTDEDKTFVGWFWYNKNKETRYWMEDETLLALKGEKAELFDILYRIYIDDRLFFKDIIEKLEMVGLWTFETEIKRRATMAGHISINVKYVIYGSDDYGHTEGEPIDSIFVMTTGDPNADQTTAIKRYLARKNNQSEDEVMGVGFYNAMTFDEYEAFRDEHIDDLRAKLTKALEQAIW